MKPRSQYSVTIEYFIPERELRATPDQQWEYLMAIFRDVLEVYPDAGVTVTRTNSPQRRLQVTGTDRAPVERLLQKSEETHQGLLASGELNAH